MKPTALKLVHGAFYWIRWIDSGSLTVGEWDSESHEFAVVGTDVPVRATFLKGDGTELPIEHAECWRPDDDDSEPEVYVVASVNASQSCGLDFAWEVGP